MDTSQNNEPHNPQNEGNTNPNTEDKPTIGLSILSFIIPIVGFILAAVNRKSKPISAKRYLIFAVASIVLFIFLCIVLGGDDNLNMCMDHKVDNRFDYCKKSCFEDKNLEGCYEGELDSLPIAEYLCESPSNEELTKRIQQYNSTAKDGKKINVESACIFRDILREGAAKHEKEIEERKKRERFENSPRGRCERNCDQIFERNTDTWSMCMVGCKEMKSN